MWLGKPGTIELPQTSLEVDFVVHSFLKKGPSLEFVRGPTSFCPRGLGASLPQGLKFLGSELLPWGPYSDSGESHI